MGSTTSYWAEEQLQFKVCTRFIEYDIIATIIQASQYYFIDTHNDREGFSYHQETPSISRYLVNPVMGYVIPSRPTLSQVEVMDSNRWAQTSKNECKHPVSIDTKVL